MPCSNGLRGPLTSEQQNRRLAGGVRMVEYHPSMVVLRYIGLCPLVEPMNSSSQGDDCGERTGRHQGGRPLSGNPLEPHQERELPLHALGQVQRVTHKVKHRDGGLLLACERPGVAIGRIQQ